MNHVRPSSTSARIRAQLDHPVIDSDGHILEFEPAVLDYLKEVGGQTCVESLRSWWSESLFMWHRLSPEERRARRTPRITWWGRPTKNTLDQATVTLPRLLYERLDEIGLDFAILYPTVGLGIPHIGDEALRRSTCRAFNRFYADSYREFADRLRPVAVIPMHTPQEAIEELEYAVNGLGMKAVLLAGYVRRPIAAVARRYPDVQREASWMDTFGLDSEYDYDPVWSKCAELKVAPTFHSSGMGWGSRTSVSNYMYNHIGMFAAAGEALCKSLFLGGVTWRFPNLRFAFLEGGAGWACNLYADLLGHWEKRNLKALENYNPANLDRDLLIELYDRYGGDMVKRTREGADRELFGEMPEDRATIDEWAACHIERAEDIRDTFVSKFYFGCEADDPLNAWAFNTKVNPLGARLRVLFSSDIGHWDVPDMTEVLEEAYELVEADLITPQDFRDFVFANTVSFYTSVNPEFFKDTIVEREVEKLRAEESF